MDLFCLEQLPEQLPERLAEFMKQFIKGFGKQFVRLEHTLLLWLQCLCGIELPLENTRWEAVSGKLSNAQSAPVPCFPTSLVSPLSSGSLGSWALISRSARPSQGSSLSHGPSPWSGVPRSLCVRAALAPPPKGPGRCGKEPPSRASGWRRGGAGPPARAASLRPGWAGSARQGAEHGRERGAGRGEPR